LVQRPVEVKDFAAIRVGDSNKLVVESNMMSEINCQKLDLEQGSLRLGDLLSL
jgi:hypothetical protein